MIFVSSSCLKKKYIKDSVEELAKNGFQNIELSGGTEYYENFEKDLLELKYKYKLNYRCHNYFPPPKLPFVLNLASLNDETFQNSYKHLQKVIALSNRLGSKKFGFHSDFTTEMLQIDSEQMRLEDSQVFGPMGLFTLMKFRKIGHLPA